MKITRKIDAPPLPEKPSELLILALEDLVKSLELGLRVDMKYWTDGRWDDEVCTVCLGGAVMVQELGITVPYNTDRYDQNRIRALDSMRLGYWHRALGLLDIFGRQELNNDLSRINIPPYSHDPSLFFKRMIECAMLLEAAGL